MAVVVSLCALTLFAYANSFEAGFTLDNKQLILNDTRVHAATADNIGLIINRSYWWPHGESGLYRPFTTFTYLLNYAVLGNRDKPAGYHWTNLVIHTVNVLLVYALMWQITGRVAAAAVTAAVWAVIPLSTEAVTNIVGRADLLAAFAVIAGLLIYLKGREASGATRWRWTAALTVVTTVGVFSKESAIVLPASIALYEVVWWTPRRSARALRLAAAAVAPAVLLMWVMRSVVLGAAPTAEFPFVDNPITAAGYWAAVMTSLNVMLRYLWLLIWPARLSVDYSYPQIPLAQGSVADWFVVAAVLGCGAATVALRHRHRTLFFFIAFAFLTFLPVSNLLFATGTIMAERLMYLPSLSIAAAFAVAVFSISTLLGTRLIPLALTAVVVGGFAARTWTRNRDWRDDVTLWSAAVSVSPKSAKAHRALAEALYAADPTRANIDRVIAEAEQSVALLASLPDDLSSPQSYRQAAAYHLDKAGDLRAREGESVAEQRRREYERALELLTRSVSIIDRASARAGGSSDAPKADVHRLLVSTHLGLGNADQAVTNAIEARRLDPLNAVGHRLVAMALLAAYRPDDAAIALMVGSMVIADASFREEVIRLYRNGLDASGCAIASGPNGPMLDPMCPMVRRHICAASVEATALNLWVGRRSAADQLSATATQLGCSANISSRD